MLSVEGVRPFTLFRRVTGVWFTLLKRVKGVLFSVGVATPALRRIDSVEGEVQSHFCLPPFDQLLREDICIQAGFLFRNFSSLSSPLVCSSVCLSQNLLVAQR